jgi:hypothetical protein
MADVRHQIKEAHMTSRTVALFVLFAVGWFALAFADEDARYTGTISQVGCIFDKTGVTAIIITLAEHPKITFEIERDYGVQKGFRKVLDIYKERGMRATSGVMGAFYKDTGLEGRKASLVCSKLQEDKCPVKSLEWND